MKWIWCIQKLRNTTRGGISSGAWGKRGETYHAFFQQKLSGNHHQLKLSVETISWNHDHNLFLYNPFLMSLGAYQNRFKYYAAPKLKSLMPFHPRFDIVLWILRICVSVIDIFIIIKNSESVFNLYDDDPQFIQVLRGSNVFLECKVSNQTNNVKIYKSLSSRDISPSKFID